MSWIKNYKTWKDKVCVGSTFIMMTIYTVIEIVGNRFPKLRLGNLNAYRDWGYAGDYVEAMWLMLQQDNADDYVVCTGETHTIEEFLDIAFNYSGIDDWKNYVVVDPKFYRPSEVDYLRGDCSKAKKNLGGNQSTTWRG